MSPFQGPLCDFLNLVSGAGFQTWEGIDDLESASNTYLPLILCPAIHRSQDERRREVLSPRLAPDQGLLVYICFQLIAYG